MTILDANFLNYNSNSIEVVNNGLGVKLYETGPIEASSEGLTLKLSSITNAMLYGEIANEKLEKEYIQSDGSISFIDTLNMNYNKITGLMPGVNYNDAINKSQLDQLSMNMKNALDPVLVVTIEHITLSNLQTIDGVLTKLNDRVLVTNQIDKKDNGIYIVNNTDWIRASDVPINYNINGKFIMVLAGVIFHSTGWICSNGENNAIVGTDNLNIIQFTDINNMTYDFGLLFDSNTNILKVYSQDLIGNGLIIDNLNKIIINIKDSSLYLDEFGIKVNINKGFNLVPGGLNIGLSDGFEFDNNDYLTLISNYPLQLDQTGLTLLYDYEFDIDSENKLILNLGYGLNKDINGIYIDTGNGITSNPNVSLTTLNLNWNIGGINTITNVKDPINNTDVTNKKWVVDEIEKSSVQKDIFILTSIDISNKYIELSTIPISTSRINLVVAEAPSQFYGIDFRQDNNILKRLTWDGLGMDGRVLENDSVVVFY
jgi:hypothetical protein